MSDEEQPYVIWKATFTMAFERAINPLHAICRMPYLVRNADKDCIYCLCVDLDSAAETVTFHAYIRVDPDNIHIVHGLLQCMAGFDGFSPIQQEPGDAFDAIDNPTILSFRDVEFSWIRPFNVIGKVSEVGGLTSDVSGWFWCFNLVDFKGETIRCWYMVDNEDGELQEGAKLSDVNEGDLALCVNAYPRLEGDGICIGRDSEFLIFNDGPM